MPCYFLSAVQSSISTIRFILAFSSLTLAIIKNLSKIMSAQPIEGTCPEIINFRNILQHLKTVFFSRKSRFRLVERWRSCPLLRCDAEVGHKEVEVESGV